jgi:hypothetical protein
MIGQKPITSYRDRTQKRENIGNKTKNKDKQSKNTTQKAKKMMNTHPTN